MTKFDIAILGGDRRTACMAPIFVEKGYRVVCFRTVPVPCSPSIKSKISFTDSLREALDSAPILIGGIPFAKSDFLYCEGSASNLNLSEIQRSIHKHQKIFAGVIPEDFRRTCEEREISCYDFMRDEPMTLQCRLHRGRRHSRGAAAQRHQHPYEQHAGAGIRQVWKDSRRPSERAARLCHRVLE